MCRPSGARECYAYLPRAYATGLGYSALRARFFAATAGIIFPELLKNRETFSPRSARRAISSAATGFRRLTVFFINNIHYAGRPHIRDTARSAR